MTEVDLGTLFGFALRREYFHIATQYRTNWK